jgi:hypothetical protein
MRALLLGPLSLLCTLACSDPVRDKGIESLGDEKPGVPEGPLHRPGQPCVLCHDGSGPGDSVFSLAGTVYQTEGQPVPFVNALVKFTDSVGRTHEVGTNCAGNFFVVKTDYEPVYPVWVKLQFGFQVTPGDPHLPFYQPMGTPIYREGSCAKCHGSKVSAESKGPVYFAPADVPFPFPPFTGPCR